MTIPDDHDAKMETRVARKTTANVGVMDPAASGTAPVPVPVPVPVPEIVLNDVNPVSPTLIFKVFDPTEYVHVSLSAA